MGQAGQTGQSLIEPSTLSNSEEIRTVGALRDPAVWIGTAGGFGYAPIAPGTFGSFAAVLLFLAAVWADLGFATYVVAVGVVSGVGIWASDRCEKAFGKKDDGRIVIDEVAGQLITLAPVFFVGPGLTRTGIAWVVTGFVLFRVLDIWKPGPVRWAERRFQGGLGVMADDLLAGAIGAVLLATALWVLSA